VTPVLLDTHYLLWIAIHPNRVPTPLAAAMAEGRRPFWYSQVSLWEIQIKYDLGKLTLPGTPRDSLVPGLRSCGLLELPLENEAIWFLPKLPRIHGDPFDRLLIAQAAVLGYEIATDDERVKKYPVRTFSV
jgi:PIN domain nuclease of toxin-antitoxin system